MWIFPKTVFFTQNLKPWLYFITKNNFIKKFEVASPQMESQPIPQPQSQPAPDLQAPVPSQPWQPSQANILRVNKTSKYLGQKEEVIEELLLTLESKNTALSVLRDRIVDLEQYKCKKDSLEIENKSLLLKISDIETLLKGSDKDKRLLALELENSRRLQKDHQSATQTKFNNYESQIDVYRQEGEHMHGQLIARAEELAQMNLKMETMDLENCDRVLDLEKEIATLKNDNFCLQDKIMQERGKMLEIDGKSKFFQEIEAAKTFLSKSNEL
jgi:hypothetical protein